jgi:excisionase family DNA binding protein
MKGRNTTRPQPRDDLAPKPTSATPAPAAGVVADPAVEDASANGIAGKLLLTTTEAAQALGIGRSKLYELIRTGAVESVLIGSCRRVPAVSVVKYVEALRAATSGPHHHGR